MASVAVPYKFKSVTVNNTASTDITLLNTPDSNFIRVLEQHWDGNDNYSTYVETAPFSFVCAADAALGIGQKLFTFPEGQIQGLGGNIYMESLAPTGLSATAGEVGLGTVIATGAIATLGAGAATMENLMEGTTISNHVAATTLTTKKSNVAVAPAATGHPDGTSTALSCHFNIASTFNQTSGEALGINVLKIRVAWRYLGDW